MAYTDPEDTVDSATYFFAERMRDVAKQVADQQDGADLMPPGLPSSPLVRESLSLVLERSATAACVTSVKYRGGLG